MITFICALVILFLGYFLYGKLAERIFKPDFGPVVFLWIVFGSILGGAVHDYMSGMISIRMNGASLSEIIGKYLGKYAKQFMRVFSVFLRVF